MRRFLISTGTVLLSVALLMSGTPAQASEMSWADDVGEAHLTATGTLDIAKVTLNYDGAKFVVTLNMKEVGDPAPFGTGQWFGFRFVYGEGTYTMRVTQDRFAGDNFQFQEKVGDAQVSAIACRTCKFKIDRAASKVHMEIGAESLKSALRKLAPGSSIETLTASTGPAYSDPSGAVNTAVGGGPNLLWGGNPGDSSVHPDGASFTF